MAPKGISRDDLLVLLSSMGIALPDTTKLSAEDLSKRLDKAFDASQEFSKILNSTPVDPDAFRPWPSSKKLYKATQRGNLTEMFEGSMEHPKRGDHASKDDIFREMRQSILCIAYMCDKGTREFCYVNKNGNRGIFVKVLDVREVTANDPLFLFEYKDIALTSKENLHSLFGSDPVTFHITDLEHRALLKLFGRNAKKLHEKYHMKEESSYDKTFVLPLCPLNMQTLGKLTVNTGCEVCGKKDVSRCLQCLSVVYCSKECQKQDWSEHKLACRSLRGGTWNVIKLNELFGKFRTTINRLDTLSTPTRTGTTSQDSETPPSDVHRGKIFLAKFQIALGTPLGPHMMIYDRQRSFQLIWKRESDTKLFDRANEIMNGTANKYKFYRWVRRVGDYELEVCLDRPPQTDPVW